MPRDIEFVDERKIQEVIDDAKGCEDKDGKGWLRKNKENNGLFLAHNGSEWVACDNTTWECWTEDFKTQREALEWLLRRQVEDYPLWQLIGLRKPITINDAVETIIKSPVWDLLFQHQEVLEQINKLSDATYFAAAFLHEYGAEVLGQGELACSTEKEAAR